MGNSSLKNLVKKIKSDFEAKHNHFFSELVENFFILNRFFKNKNVPKAKSNENTDDNNPKKKHSSLMKFFDNGGVWASTTSLSKREQDSTQEINLKKRIKDIYFIEFKSGLKRQNCGILRKLPFWKRNEEKSSKRNMKRYLKPEGAFMEDNEEGRGTLTTRTRGGSITKSMARGVGVGLPMSERIQASPKHFDSENSYFLQSSKIFDGFFIVWIRICFKWSLLLDDMS